MAVYLCLSRHIGELTMSSVCSAISRLLLTLALAIYLMGLIGQAKANESAVTDFWIGNKFDGSLRKNRIDVAKEMLKDLQQFRNYLPVQKPTELDWIKAEREALGRSYSQAMHLRLLGLTESAEFKHMEISNLGQSIADALECVVNPQVALNREMFCWSVASFNISDSSWKEGIPILIKSGRLPKEVEPPGKNIGLFNPASVVFHRVGRNISEFIVIPYLGGKIRE